MRTGAFWGSAAGSVDVGLQRIRVDPGKWSTPAHAEGAEEEIFFVLGGSGISWQDGDVYEVGEGDCLGVPYGILVPKGWSNLWVAGRCHSSDTKVHGSIRAQSAAYMMGQAAATAAVQSIRTGQPACDLDTEALVETLRAAGAYLPQQTLSKTMTR